MTCSYCRLADLTSEQMGAIMINVTTARDLIAELPADTDAIPLPLVRRVINEHLTTVRWDADLQAKAVQAGAIKPIRKAPGPVAGGRARKYQGGPGLAVDREQAVLILTAACLAEAAEVPVISMIRVLRVSGVDPQVFTQDT